MGDIFGDLAENPAYVAAFSDALTSLWTKGVRATLADYLGASPELADVVPWIGASRAFRSALDTRRVRPCSVA